MNRLIPLLILISSCKLTTKDDVDTQSPRYQEIRDSIRDKVDSMVGDRIATIYWDTIGVSNAPIKVISSKLIKRSSLGRDIRLVWKNVSNKNITAIRFRWYGLNAFNRPADMGINSMAEGFGGGFTDDLIRPGKTDYGEWSIISRDGKKVVLAWPVEVVFEDGSKWESQSNP